MKTFEDTHPVSRRERETAPSDRMRPAVTCRMSMREGSLCSVLAAVLVLCSLSWASTFSLYSGFSDEQWDQVAKYHQWGLMDAFNAIGLTRLKYVPSTPREFEENAFVPEYWKYTHPEFDSVEADAATLTVHSGHGGTFKQTFEDSFDFMMQPKSAWNGIEMISGSIMGLGESQGYYAGDAYPGYCRYFMAMGCNTLAVGPAMSDDGHPTYSRPDLFDKYNSRHADPYKIWRKAMTDGLRMVMGFTDYSYGTPFDRENWGRFQDYYQKGYSIATCFAYTALNAHSAHKPVVVVQAETIEACHAMLDNEHDFKTDRPRSGPGAPQYLACYWWGGDRVKAYDGPYVWSGSGGGDVKGGAAAASCAVYQGTDSKEQEQAAMTRFLHALGIQGDVGFSSTLRKQALYHVDDKRFVWVDSGSGHLYYRDTRCQEGDVHPCRLAQEQAVDIASSFLATSQIVGKDEVAVDRVISVNRMVATKEEILSDTRTSDPEVARYIVVFKRNLGTLPILTERCDTVMVEVDPDGEVASLVSHYKCGRTVKKVASLKSRFANLDIAKASLAATLAAKDVKAGILPLEDGVYVPVYEVTTLGIAADGTPNPRIDYLRMDTLQPIEGSQAGPAQGYELEENTASQTRDR